MRGTNTVALLVETKSSDEVAHSQDEKAVGEDGAEHLRGEEKVRSSFLRNDELGEELGFGDDGSSAFPLTELCTMRSSPLTRATVAHVDTRGSAYPFVSSGSPAAPKKRQGARKAGRLTDRDDEFDSVTEGRVEETTEGCRDVGG